MNTAVTMPMPIKKVSKLRGVDPKSAEPSRPKILIFGKPGVGKTWGALDFPNCYYIDTEGGANLQHYTTKLKDAGGVYMGPEQGSQDFPSVIEEVKALATEEHSFKTLVIDSLSQLELSEIAQESERMIKTKRDMTKTFGAEKKPAVAYERQLLNWLERLDMNVVLICHEKNEWKDDKMVGTTFDAWEKLGYSLHLCLNIIKTGDTRRAIVKKSRLEQFPDAASFVWSYDEFAEKYGKAVIVRDTKKIELATEAQLARYKELMEMWKSPEDQEEKWLNAAKADTIKDIDTDKMSKIISYIETQLKGEKI